MHDHIIIRKKTKNAGKPSARGVIRTQPDRKCVFLQDHGARAASEEYPAGMPLKDCTKPYITVIGKGKKTRTLYILPKLVSHLRRYIKEVHGESSNKDSYLFYSRNGNHKAQISSKAIEKRLHMYAERAHQKCNDVPLNLHAHQFRHARATHWLEEGINIVEISVLLGHEQRQQL